MHFVFFDPSGKRKRIVKIFIFSIIGVFILSLCILIASIILKPELSGTGYFKAISHRFGYKKHAFNPKISKTKSWAELLKELSDKSFSWKENMKFTIDAFGVEWDDGSRESLKENLNQIDTLILEEFSVSATGWVDLISPEKFKKTLASVRKSRPNEPIVPLINNYNTLSGTWDNKLLSQILSDSTAREDLELTIKEVLQQYQLQGISIDLENMDDGTLPFYYEFLEELHSLLMQENLTISVNIPLNNDSYDYTRISDAVDQVMLMAYDEHWLTGEAGPIASLDWFEDGIREIEKVVPKEKIGVILWNYGYDWNISKKTTSALTFQEAISLARESENSIDFDTGSLNPGFSYTDENGDDHEIWYLDAVTAWDQMQAIDHLGIHHVWLWRLGSEDPSFWEILKQNDPHAWEHFWYGYALTYDATGELYKVTGLPRNGTRSIDIEDNMIVDEDVSEYPLPYTVTRYGWGSKKKIVLTFDDGPDPKYTPQILDILKESKAPATFFMIGMNAEKYPDIVRRAYNEGHLIGNHSFSHPEISKIGEIHTDIELSLTERIFESILWHGTSLFRPPYGEDVEPESPSDILPLIRANDLGYISVGMKIDPNDWSRPGVDAIIQSTLDQIDDGKWNIILLHDSGGEREQTIAALPKLIQSIRDRGYTIVPLSDLIGLSRDIVMPETPEKEKFLILSDSLLFIVLSIILGWVLLLSAFGLTLGILRFAIILSLAWRRFHHEKKKKQREATPFVSVIVPAYNESSVIVRTLESLIASTYPHFETIVIDDGSTDNTYDVARTYADSHEKISVYTKENAGKGMAINHGIQHATGSIIIVIDADTLFETNTIAELMHGFTSEDIAAVSGNVKVGNRNSLLTRLQAIEYITSQNLDRRAYAMMNAITVVPGAVWAWRKSVIESLWWFSHQTLAEDSDLTIMLLKTGYRVAFAPNAIAYTEAPESWGSLAKQRFRWMFWVLQVTWKHRDILTNDQVSVGLRFFTFPYMILTQTIFPIFWPIIDFFAIIGVIFSLVNYYVFDSYHYLSTTLLLFETAGILFLLEIIISSIAFSFEKHENKNLLFLLPLQKFLYRFFLYWIGIKSILYALTGKRTLWNKLERTNSVHLTK